jgi:hypothetical protein
MPLINVLLTMRSLQLLATKFRILLCNLMM